MLETLRIISLTITLIFTNRYIVINYLLSNYK